MALGGAHTVFIVDDDVDTTQSLHWLLELSGYQVHSANTAEACLELANRVSPDIVLIDLCMPYISGFELHKRLKSHPSCQATRFVAYSGMGDAEMVKRIAEAGFDAQLLKPSDHAQVLKVLEAVAES